MSMVTASLLPEPPRRQHPEDDLQRACVQYLRVALPDDALYFHVPNGGQRHSRAAARLVGLGTRAGIPDLCVIYYGRLMCIELKARRGALSAVQRQMHVKLQHCGVLVLLCRSVADVELGLRTWGVPLRASVAA